MSPRTTREHIDRAALTHELLMIVTAVWYDIDHVNGTGASAFFTPDAELWFGERCFHGTAEIDAAYAVRAARGARVSRHIVTNMHLTSVGPTEVTAVSNLVMFAEDGEPPRTAVAPVIVSDVVDEFELRDDIWQIRSRCFTPMFVSPQASLAMPSA